MEQNIHSELEEELDQIDVDSLKLDAAIQLRAWQKRMYSLIDQTHKIRLHQLDSMANDLTTEIEEKQKQIKHIKVNDRNTYRQLKNDIALLKSNIEIIESIPENFQHRIERTVRLSRQEEIPDEEVSDDDDDDTVLVDIDRHEKEADFIEEEDARTPVTHEEGRVSKIFHSEPVQRSIAIGLVKAITQIGVITATSTTTVAATTMAKTAVIATVCGVGTVAYGVGRIAVGATRRVWSWAVSSEE